MIQLNVKGRSHLVSIIVTALMTIGLVQAQPPPTELFLEGFSVVPEPRNVELTGSLIELNSQWGWDTVDVDPGHIALKTLLGDLSEVHQLELRQAGAERKTIQLKVQPGAVPDRGEVSEQAYRLVVTPEKIEITGNGDPGLFYGVQTLLQLVRETGSGRLQLPGCRIEDWPSFRLRFLHFDTKHHQDRIETLKRYLDWAARYKVNMIAYELEDKFEYPSNPVIGAPGAFTTAQLQEIVDYGLERFIQVVPDVQSPAHLAYVLKHPEFAHLRSDGNNYQSCLCDEETYELIFSMYDDVIQATQGVDYFLVSTDELYYAGICEKCEKPYNPENRSLIWVDFARRARDFLHERGRRMICWVEYPLLPEHISLLPPDIIDGVLGSDPDFINAENEIGLRQLVYTSIQGGEYLFPNYWSAVGSDFRSRQGRLQSVYQALSAGGGMGNPTGVFGAAWGDSGLHSETFWLGWSAVAQYGWTRGTPSVEQHVEEYINSFYGPGLSDMVQVFQGLQRQARFFKESWDRVVSRARESGYGNSNGPGIGITRRDDTLPQPPLPRLPGLDFIPVYTGTYSELVSRARVMEGEAQNLIHLIYSNLSRARQNRYSLEVFLSLARFTHHHGRMIISMELIENHLADARRSAASNHPERAVASLASGIRTAGLIIQDRNRTFEALQLVWEESRYPKGRSVGGKDFYHVLDDVKDHFADRRPDLTYLTAPEESIMLEEWIEAATAVLREYAGKHGVAVPSVHIELEPEE